MVNERTEMEFEDLLVEVGDFGKYQKRLLYCFMLPAGILLPWFTMNILFLVFTPDHWCFVPEVAASNLTIEAQRHLIAPADKPNCFMYDLNYTEALLSSSFQPQNTTPIIPCNKGYQYDNTDFDETAASKWNMVCENSHYSSLAMTLTNVGSIISTPIYGFFSDRVGRKPVYFVVILVTVITSLSSVLMTNFIAFMVLRTINGSLMPSVFQLPYIILLEIVGPSERTKMNGIANASWSVGLCTMPLIAYLSRDWVTFGLATSSVSVLFFLYWGFLPESPRWLLSQERYAEAATIVTRIADTNRKQMDPVELRMKIQKLGERIKKEKVMGEVNNTTADLLRYPNLRKKFLIITFCWVADILAYYGLIINVANLAGSPFLNVFYLAFAEVPGFIYSWIFMQKIGRRWCSVSSLLITGLSCLPPVFLPADIPYVAVVSSLIGRFGAAAAFMGVYQQSSELYPTTVRAIGMGMSGTFAGLANIIVPYIVFLAIFGKYIPFLIIGLTCILAGISATFLPETLNEILPQTISDAETFGKGQKFFSWNRKKVSMEPEEEEGESPKLLNGGNTENSSL